MDLCLFKGLPQSEFIFLFHDSPAIAGYPRMLDSPLASSSLLSKNELFREIRNSEKLKESRWPAVIQ